MSQVPAAVLATRVGLRSALTVARSSSAGPRALPLASISLGDLGGPCTKGRTPAAAKPPAGAQQSWRSARVSFLKRTLGGPWHA